MQSIARCPHDAKPARDKFTVAILNTAAPERACFVFIDALSTMVPKKKTEKVTEELRRGWAFFAVSFVSWVHCYQPPQGQSVADGSRIKCASFMGGSAWDEARSLAADP